MCVVAYPHGRRIGILELSKQIAIEMYGSLSFQFWTNSNSSPVWIPLCTSVITVLVFPESSSGFAAMASKPKTTEKRKHVRRCLAEIKSLVPGQKAGDRIGTLSALQRVIQHLKKFKDKGMRLIARRTHNQSRKDHKAAS